MKNTKDNTILVISHQERILNIADEIILLKDGKIIESNQKLEDILSENSIHCKKTKNI